MHVYAYIFKNVMHNTPYIMFKSGETVIKHVVVSSGPNLMELHLSVSNWPN